MKFFYGYLSPNSDHERSELESERSDDSTVSAGFVSRSTKQSNSMVPTQWTELDSVGLKEI